MASTVPSRIYLISKWGDVALGLSTGVFAYYLYEKKLGRTPDDSLAGLVRWKLDQRRAPPLTTDATNDDWDAQLSAALSTPDDDSK